MKRRPCSGSASKIQSGTEQHVNDKKHEAKVAKFLQMRRRLPLQFRSVSAASCTLVQ